MRFFFFFKVNKILLGGGLNVSRKNIVFGENMRIHRPYIIDISQNADLREEFTENLFFQVLEYFSQVGLVLKP